MIELKDIYKSFNNKVVLEDVSAVFEKGKINLIIGASGSGKSVLMKCMVGLVPVDKGSVHYDNRNFTDMSYDEKRDVRKEIGMLFQGSALFDSLSVEENVAFPLKMFGKMKPDEIRERVNSCLRRVNLENINHQYPSEISGGMKKRVGIARAIALNPEYLFVDEPNSGLDPLTSRVIDELIKEITQEYQMTTIVNTHDMKTVYEIGDKVIFIYKGRKRFDGLKSEIASSNIHELTEFVRASDY
jgi:phospholipid/cholesterol/gamma-HCH transport system ATP-binding protein